MQDVDADVRGIAVNALDGIAENAENKVLMTQAGAIEPLVLLLQGEDAETARDAESALRKIAYRNDMGEWLPL